MTVSKPPFFLAFNQKYLLECIELVESADLHRALKSLSIEEQTLISYIFYKEKTQRELAKIYKVTHQSINYKINIIIHKIKKYLLNK